MNLYCSKTQKNDTFVYKLLRRGFLQGPTDYIGYYDNFNRAFT